MIYAGAYLNRKMSVFGWGTRRNHSHLKNTEIGKLLLILDKLLVKVNSASFLTFK